MVLVRCKECGAEVSTQAETCPKCGVKKPTKKHSGCFILIVGFLALGIIGLIFSPSTPPAVQPKAGVSSQDKNDIAQKTAGGNISACDNGDPEQVYRMLREIVVYDRTAEEPIFIHVRPDFWAVLKNDASQRRKLMESIANTDACLVGKPRSLYLFDPDSNMIGKATPSSGIQMQ